MLPAPYPDPPAFHTTPPWLQSASSRLGGAAPTSRGCSVPAPKGPCPLGAGHTHSKSANRQTRQGSKHVEFRLSAAFSQLVLTSTRPTIVPVPPESASPTGRISSPAPAVSILLARRSSVPAQTHLRPSGYAQNPIFFPQKDQRAAGALV